MLRRSALLAATAAVVAAVGPADAAAAATVCPSGADLGAASPFNVVALAGATLGKSSGDDTEGDVAIGGDAVFTQYYVGQYTGHRPALVVGGGVSGTVAFESGATGTYATTSSATDPTSGQPTAGLTQAAPPFSFTDLANRLDADSANYASQPQTPGATATTSQGALYLQGADPTLDVFDLSAGALDGPTALYIDVPAGATALVNWPATGAATLTITNVWYFVGSGWQQVGQYGSSGGEAQRDSTLLNVPDATSLTMNGGQLSLTLLAPQTSVTLSGVELDGNVLAHDLGGAFQSNFVPAFAGCSSGDPGGPPPTLPEAPLPVAMVAVPVAAGALLFARRRRAANRR